MTVVPFTNQIAFSPVARSRHRMSDLPSPSKSPTPAMLQLRSITVEIGALLESVVPFMSQIAFWPVVLLRHKISDIPSPLKSAPTIRRRVVLTKTGAVHAE